MTLVAMEGDLILLMKDHFPVINDHEVIIFAALSIVNFELKNQGCKESRPLCKLYCSLSFDFNNVYNVDNDIVVSTAGDDDGNDENTSSIADGGSSEITVAFD